MVGGDAATVRRVRATEILEEHFDEILADFEGLIGGMNLSDSQEASTRELFMAKSYGILDRALNDLRDENDPATGRVERDLYERTGFLRSRENVAGAAGRVLLEAFSEVALLRVAGELPPGEGSGEEIARTALAIQSRVHEVIAKETPWAQDYLLRKVHASRAEERRRIGRDLHDRLAHSLAVIIQSIELYETFRVGDPSQAETELRLARDMSNSALGLVRELSMDLRSPEAGEGLAEALSDLLRTSVPPATSCDLSVEGEESLLEAYVRDELFLILREAVRNAVAHAGASSIRVDLCATPGSVVASVRDDGSGFDPERGDPAGGMGLSSMAERANLVGGVLLVSSAPGHGTRVEIRIPLSQGEAG